MSYDRETGVFIWRKHRKSSMIGCRAGGAGAPGYRSLTVGGVRYPEHRLAWLYVYGEWPAALIDHRDMDKSNNKIENLRQATHSTNKANRIAPSWNTTGFKGVSFNKRQRCYQASICKQYKQMHLGFYATAEEAHAAYSKAAHELFGEFARVS